MTLLTAYEAALARVESGEELRTYVPHIKGKPETKRQSRDRRAHREATFMEPDALEGYPCTNCYCLCIGAHVPGRYGRCANQCRCYEPAILCRCGDDSTEHEWDNEGTACAISGCKCLSFTPKRTNGLKKGPIRRILDAISASRNQSHTPKEPNPMKRPTKVLAFLAGATTLTFGLSLTAQAATTKPAKPAITSVTLSPKSLPLAGGTVTLTAKTTGANTCSLKMLASQGLHVSLPKAAQSCTKGTYQARISITKTAARHTVTLDVIAVTGDPKRATKVVYLPIVAPVVPVVTPTTTPQTTPTTTPVVVVPPAPVGPTPPVTSPPTSVPPVALDPTCIPGAVDLEQDCTFSVSDVGGNLTGGVLSFATTEVPNDPNATLATPATVGCTLNITSEDTQSTCDVRYPASGTYYIQTLFDGGPNANSASSIESIDVTNTGPLPTVSVLTATSSSLNFTVTDSNGNVSVADGAMAITVQVWANEALQDTWTFTTSSPGQQSCDMGWSVIRNQDGANVWTPSSNACAVTETQGGLDETGSISFFAQAAFMGSASDLPSTAPQIPFSER